MIRGRDDIPFAKRIVIKAGTSVVSTPDGFPSLSRMADIVEHVSAVCRFIATPINFLSVEHAMQHVDAFCVLDSTCRPHT